MDTIQEIREILKEMAERQAIFDVKFNEQVAFIANQQAKNDANFNKILGDIAKSDAKIKEANQKKSYIEIDQCYSATEFFYHSLNKKLVLGNMKFDSIYGNLWGHEKNIQDEFDIVMYNGNSLVIIETKHKVHTNDIEKLVSKKVDNFRYLFPKYQNYKIYLGIAGFSIPQDVENMAKNLGIAVLREKGEVVQIEAKNLKVY